MDTTKDLLLFAPILSAILAASAGANNGTE